MLELYQFDYLLRNVSKLKSKRHRLKNISGQTGVPTLVDSGRNVIITGDEKRIITYLHKHYRPASIY